MTSPDQAGTLLLVASRNPGKAAELAGFVRALGYRVLTLSEVGLPHTDAEEALEVHATFEANAIAKAAFYHSACGGLPTVADDSGLEVRALGGAPGVLSRRWGGAAGRAAEVDRANNEALLRRMEGVSDRTARFVCAVALARAGATVTARGEADGWISSTPRGAHGFGYDPIFEADDLDGRTFGEVETARKAAVSHRSRALAELAVLLGRASDNEPR